MSSGTGRRVPCPNFAGVLHPVISDDTAARPSRVMYTNHASGNIAWRYSTRRHIRGYLSRYRAPPVTRWIDQSITARSFGVMLAGSTACDVHPPLVDRVVHLPQEVAAQAKRRKCELSSS